MRDAGAGCQSERARKRHQDLLRQRDKKPLISAVTERSVVTRMAARKVRRVGDRAWSPARDRNSPPTSTPEWTGSETCACNLTLVALSNRSARAPGLCPQV